MKSIVHYHTIPPATMYSDVHINVTTFLTKQYSKIPSFFFAKASNACNIINQPISTSSLTDLLCASGNIYVSPFTTTQQTSTCLNVPPEILDMANAMRTQYMSIATVIRSPTNSRVSFKELENRQNQHMWLEVQLLHQKWNEMDISLMSYINRLRVL